MQRCANSVEVVVGKLQSYKGLQMLEVCEKALVKRGLSLNFRKVFPRFLQPYR